MGRIRTIKPETFDDPDLNELPLEARWLFIGLWTQADRDGRLEDDARRLQARLLPYDRELNCEQILSWLAPRFITRYEVDGRKFIQINNFDRHQRPHPKEAPSTYPGPEDPKAVKLHGKPGKGTVEPGKAGASKVDLGMDYGSGNGCVSMAGREDPPAHTTHTVKTVTRKPLAYRRRIDVAWPGRPPVPAGLHEEFIDKLGGDPEAARLELLAWYPLTAAVYDNQAIGDDDFTFWRARFREWKGTTAKPIGATGPPRPTDDEIWADIEAQRALRKVGRPGL